MKPRDLARVHSFPRIVPAPPRYLVTTWGADCLVLFVQIGVDRFFFEYV